MRPTPLASSILAGIFLSAAAVTAWGNDLSLPPRGAPTVVESVAPSPSAPPTATPAPTASEALAAEPTAPPLPSDRVALAVELRAMLEDPEFATGGHVSAVVLDEVGRVVLEQHPTAGLLPASTMKLLVAAATLQRHEGDERLATKVLVRGEVSLRGTLAGDVIVVGGGDPALTSSAYRRFVYPARPASDAGQLAEVLRAAGIARITGDVIADPGSWADNPLAPGWIDGYLADFNARRITGLTVDAGLVVDVAAPEAAWDALTSEQVDDGAVRITMAPDPLQHAADVFRDELRRARMSVEGEARVGRTPPDARPIGELQSPPIADLLAFMLKQSDNHLADTLFRQVGADGTSPSTWASSAGAVAERLAARGIDLTDAVIADGSGLSRHDRLSARTLAQLDHAMSSSQDAELWASLQSVAGQDGTLRHRLAGTLAAGRFRGKTGTLADVRSLVGAVDGPDGRRYHLALVANGGEVWRTSALADRMVLRLARSLWCTGVDTAVVGCAA